MYLNHILFTIFLLASLQSDDVMRHLFSYLQPKEEVRKVAYDILLLISSSLGNSSSLSSEACHQKLISMASIFH